jgi:hypothetical protein
MSYNRTRVRGGFTPSTAAMLEYFKWQTCAQTSYTQVGTYDTFAIGSKEQMDDTVTPNFKFLQRSGKTVFTDMSYYKWESDLATLGQGPEAERDSTTITCSGVGRRFAAKYDGPWFANRIRPGTVSEPLNVVNVHSSSDVQELQKEVSTRCLARRGLSDSNLYESLAEIRSTLRLIRRPLDSLQRLLSRAERGRGRLGAAADVWLTYRYGVMPVVRDIGAVIQGLEKKVGEVRRTTRASGNLTRFQNDTLTLSYGTPAYTLTYGVQKTDEVVVRAMSLDEYMVDLYANIGFSTKGLVTLPWELIPYSFVADWFVNFGDFLNALVPLPGVKQLGSCLTTSRIVTNVWSPISVVRPTYNILRQASGMCISRMTTKTRTQLLPPSLVVKSDFKFDDATRMADAVALIVQRMNRVFTQRR